MTIEMNHDGPVFETGYNVLYNEGIVILQISIGNGYFKKDVIHNLIRFASNHFSQIKIVIPSPLAVYTYKALGYDDTKAEAKARLAGNRLLNHITQIVDDNKRFEIVNRSGIISHRAYQEKFQQIKSLYQENKTFSHDAQETTMNVLHQKRKDNLGKDAIEIGVRYLLEELAFILASPSLYNNSHIAYIYHKRRPILEKLINGDYDGIMREKNGFIIIK